ncbi:MAG: aldehyde dehydrogenase family protein [Alphaproteobacteria bacterium]|nr:MAG: aldehyde dehydrogenase family protein [Alphaproteobacteria bacterium]
MSLKDKFESMEYGPAPEDSAQAIAWLDAHGRKFGHFIGGEWHAVGKSSLFATYSPSDEQELARIAQGSAKDVDAAVKAARKAQPAWQKLGGHGRARYLYAIARQIQKHSRVVAVLESLDNGKSIRETRDLDTQLAARHFYHHAGWAQLADSELAGYVPHGVVGQIIPWNFPFLMLSWKIAPALAAGNTVVLKPAEFTSLSALWFADMLEQIGLPPGVVNIVTGDGRTGAALVEHRDVDKLAFTGSTEVGKIIRRSVAGSSKALTLELGGKSPYIVFEDADLDSAVEGLVDAIWFNQGQVCCAGSRLLVQESIEQAMIEKIKARMSKLRIGPSLDKCIDMSALVDASQRDTIERLVAQGKAEGATIWQPEIAMPEKGIFYPPTLITDAGSANVCMREEIFGPVLTVISFRTQAEGAQLANNTRYGLAASVWTENINRALEIAPKLKAGVVWINGTNFFDAAVGFGGYRESGFGREGGIEGLQAYLKPAFEAKLPPQKPVPLPKPKHDVLSDAIDRTAKMYVGGKQARADGGSSYPVYSAKGGLAGHAALGNRKDIRNAVEAADAASGWGASTAHLRAQIIYYLAENLEERRGEFVARLVELTGAAKATTAKEFDLSISRLFSAAAWADKYDGRVHQPPMRGVALAMNEPVGILGISCPDWQPLLSLVSLVAPAIAMGNRVVALPSEHLSLVATDLYQVIETSDVPAGVINIVTGKRQELAEVLAAHDNVDGIWHFGDADSCRAIETLATDNMKRSWLSNGRHYDFADPALGEGEHVLRRATEVKNIWIPYGDQLGGGKGY